MSTLSKIQALQSAMQQIEFYNVYGQPLLADNDYRNIDGSNNNPNFTSAGSHFIRLAPADYGPAQAPAGDDRPSARVISNEVFSQSESVPNSFHASDLLWVWGQFLDHDLDLTKGGTESFNIPVEPDDLFTAPIPFTRSAADEINGVNEQINLLTPFIDASMIYGSDAVTEALLRDAGGKMKVSDGDLLPINGGFFTAGDVRAIENIALTSMHTIFVREHNFIVDKLLQSGQSYTDEELYQAAKKIVEAEVQHITYDEFIPMVLGSNALPTYQGFDLNIDPQVANEFATSAFRLGHTLLSSGIERMNEDGSHFGSGTIALRDAFLTMQVFLDDPTNVDAILRGMTASPSEELDAQIIDDVRNFLFAPAGSTGLDLAALNIQRGRDHGLPDYNTVRVSLGLDHKDTFADITSNPILAQILENLYGNVDNIDVFVGGLAENVFNGAMVGELVYTILVDQFTRARDGDFYWYENRFTQSELAIIKDTTLSDIIMRNSDIQYMQDDAFVAHTRMNGTDKANKMAGTSGEDLIMSKNGNDSVHGWNGSDTIYGGNGNDKLEGDSGDDYLYGESGNDILFGGEGNDSLDGGLGADKIYGHNGSDWLVGGASSDRLYGGNGDDYLSGDDGNDLLNGENGNDIIEGGSGADRLNGGEGDDKLRGGDGSDKIYGNNGNDFLEGGQGNDLLYGGNGNDTFIFSGSINKDKIMDYKPGDLIQFVGYDDLDEMSDLTITKLGANTVITWDDNSITLIKVNPLSLDHDDFSFS